MIARFFVDRPIFATVISLVILLAGPRVLGHASGRALPGRVAGDLQVTASYPGANASTVRDTVAALIEEQVSGVEGMMYMSSRCTNDGAYALDSHIQARHRLGHGPGACAEPRESRVAGHSGTRAERRHQREEAVAEHADDCEPRLPDGRYDDLFLSNCTRRLT